MKTILFLATFVLASVSFASGKTYKAEPTKGAVVFNATAIGLKFQGKGEGPQGEVSLDSGVVGTFKFKMETLDTGIGLRNQHMKEKYLEVAKYPNSELKIEDVSGFKQESADGKYEFKGVLTVHGVAKPVTGQVTVKKVAEVLQIKAEFDTKISYFSIPLPAYAGVALKDDVKVSVESQLM
ncbi:YceI family protein [bacterium]|nr:YceI family protein [bacterium]